MRLETTTRQCPRCRLRYETPTDTPDFPCPHCGDTKIGVGRSFDEACADAVARLRRISDNVCGSSPSTTCTRPIPTSPRSCIWSASDRSTTNERGNDASALDLLEVAPPHLARAGRAGIVTTKEMTLFVTQRMKDLNLETARRIAQKWQVPSETISDVIAGATFGLGVTMMFESGYGEDQIVEIARRLVGKLSAPAGERGAS
jgi:hypothetical protein